MKICLYHEADFDGQCSAAIFAKSCGDAKYLLCPMDYGKEVPWTKLVNRDVTMVDFSLPEADMIELSKVAAHVTWIDHHKTAIKHYGGWFHSVSLDTSKAACVLTWEYYFGHLVPIAVRLLGSYDIWDHYCPQVLEFQAGLSTYVDTDPNNTDLWERVFASDDNFIEDVCERGAIVLDYQAKLLADNVERAAYELFWEKRPWMVCNTTLKGSRVFDSLAWSGGVISYYWDGTKYRVSLYGVPGCGSIAKKYGGGGHDQAAGFECHILPWKE